MLSKESRILRHLTIVALYQMQRVWGQSGQFYKVSVGAINLDTGDKGITRTVYEIPKLISCKARSLRKFEYDIGYLAANKNFTYGGFYEPTDRFAVVSGLDIPETITIEQKDYFIIDGRRFDIQAIQELDFHAGWFLHLRNTKENKRYAIITQHIKSKIDITSTVEIEP